MPLNSSNSVQWSMWANETVYYGSLTLLIGGIVGVIGGVYHPQFLFWFPIGIYGLVFGLIICIIEYPRGKKVKGHSVHRLGQEPLSQCIDKLSFLKSYYHRAFSYFVVCIPACLIPPTFFGAVCVLFGCIIYVSAASKHETWKPIEQPRSQPQGTASTLQVPPSRPPPRLPSSVRSAHSSVKKNIVHLG